MRICLRIQPGLAQQHMLLRQEFLRIISRGWVAGLLQRLKIISNCLLFVFSVGSVAGVVVFCGGFIPTLNANSGSLGWRRFYSSLGSVLTAQGGGHAYVKYCICFGHDYDCYV